MRARLSGFEGTMRRSGTRRALAGALLLLGGAGIGLIAGASGAALGRHPPVTQGDVAREVRRAARLADDGRPVLLVVLDPRCGACEQAREDLGGIADALEAAGVRVASLERETLRAAGARLPPGFFPAYLLFDAGGGLLASRRGYVPSSAILLWVRDLLLRPQPPRNP
jgi:hypothetical protein